MKKCGNGVIEVTHISFFHPNGDESDKGRENIFADYYYDNYNYILLLYYIFNIIRAVPENFDGMKGEYL